MGVRIRTACRDDLESLTELAQRTFRDAFAEQNDPADMEVYLAEAFTADRLGSELADSASTFLLAFASDGETAADQPIGYGKLRVGPPGDGVDGPSPIEIERIYVDQGVQGTGAGSALMGALIETAREQGHLTVWLGVWERNRRAIGFYRRWGFEVVGSHQFRLGSDDQTDLVFARSV